MRVESRDKSISETKAETLVYRYIYIHTHTYIYIEIDTCFLVQAYGHAYICVSAHVVVLHLWLPCAIIECTSSLCAHFAAAAAAG